MRRRAVRPWIFPLRAPLFPLRALLFLLLAPAAPVLWPGGGPAVLPAALAEEAWEEEARRAEQEEDRLLEEARQRGTVRQLVIRYQSRLSRQPTALNHYMLGRALWHNDDREGAERHLRQALVLQPGFWFANLRLAMLEADRQQFAAAQEHLATVLLASPRNPDALRLLGSIRLEQKDWDGARPALEELLSREPESRALRWALAWVHMQRKDWPQALRELRVLRERWPDDLVAWRAHGAALYHAGELLAASRELEAFLRIDPSDVGTLQVLAEVYEKREDWRGLLATLERFEPHVQAGEHRERLAAMIAELREAVAQGRPPRSARSEADAWPRDPWFELVEQCLDPTDPGRRRRALQTYRDAGLSVLPAVILQRVDPRLEPDPACRTLVLRLAGDLGNVVVLPHVAWSLSGDPDARVRAVAAETVPRFATDAGLVCLVPRLLQLRVGAEATADDLQEFNAVRASLRQMTGHHDGVEADWLDGAGAAASREAWVAWITSPAGIRTRLRGFRALVALGGVEPAYLVRMVLEPEPALARAGYEALLARAASPGENPVEVRAWAALPRFAPEDVDASRLAAVQDAVVAWWRVWEAARAEVERSRERAPPQEVPSAPGRAGGR